MPRHTSPDRARPFAPHLGLFLALAILGLPSLGSAQYLFGQNKVIYTPRAWKVIQTPRLDVYYYTGEQDLAEYVAEFAEKTCQEYEETFQHQFEQKIPLIVYASHHDFKQTNVVDFLISDYVGGFTELLRGRVAIPHTGSFTQLRRVTRHELVHAFMNDKLVRLMNEHRRHNYVPPPLWFSEGLAEYLAMPQPDTEAHMFMRDLVVNDNLIELRDLWRIRGTYVMYKEGESLVRYMATRFGDRALMQLLENWWYSDRFATVLEFTLGLTEHELNRGWKRFLKRRYYPALLAADWPDRTGRALVADRSLNTRPAVYSETATPNGACDFLFLSVRTGQVDLLRARQDRGDHPRRSRYDDHYLFETVVRGGRGDRVESIPAFSSGPEVHEHRLAFTCKSGDRDALLIWDLQNNREVARYKFDSLVSLASPSWSPDGREIVLRGLDYSGWSDLYRVRLEDGVSERLTFDPADDRDPDWSSGGQRIAWSSDRAAEGQDGVYHIWVLDLETGHATPVTTGDGEDAAPSFGPQDQSLLFSSDADGASNIYLLDLADRSLRRVTSTLGGVFTPQWLPDGRSFLATSFVSTSFQIYRFDLEGPSAWPGSPVLPQVAALDTPGETPTRSHTVWPRRNTASAYPKKSYDLKFGIDFVRTAVAFDPDFQSGTGGQIGFTDVLGNHQVFLHLSNSATSIDEFWRHLNLGLIYTNLSKRLHYSFGAFHLTSVYDPNLDLFRFERRYGTHFGLSYPLSRFRRLETSFVGRVAERDRDEAVFFRVGPRSVLFSNFSSFVHDNTMWSASGPMEGTRFNLTLGQTFDISGTDRGGTSAHVDLRRYTRLGIRNVFASRVIARSNWGDNVQLFYLGGPFSLRGFERRSLFARRIFLVNNELRFPLVDRLLIGFPFNSIEFSRIRGALFSDVAYLSGPFTPGWHGSFGVGVELGLGAGLVARLDTGRTHDFEELQPFTDFFLGWNY